MQEGPPLQGAGSQCRQGGQEETGIWQPGPHWGGLTRAEMGQLAGSDHEYHTWAPQATQLRGCKIALLRFSGQLGWNSCPPGARRTIKSHVCHSWGQTRRQVGRGGGQERGSRKTGRARAASWAASRGEEGSGAQNPHAASCLVSTEIQLTCNEETQSATL